MTTQEIANLTSRLEELEKRVRLLAAFYTTGYLPEAGH